jgi:hypothetical protein
MAFVDTVVVHLLGSLPRNVHGAIEKRIIDFIVLIRDDILNHPDIFHTLEDHRGGLFMPI